MLVKAQCLPGRTSPDFMMMQQQLHTWSVKKIQTTGVDKENTMDVSLYASMEMQPNESFTSGHGSPVTPARPSLCNWQAPPPFRDLL